MTLSQSDVKVVRARTCKVPLTHGHYALVDEGDFALVSKYKWHAGFFNKQIYAVALVPVKGTKKWTSLRMHRLILGARKGVSVDHKNHNGLDNRRRNIRLCTDAQNSANMRKYSGTHSKYKGVYIDKRMKNKWVACIMVRQKGIWLGGFPTEKKAAGAYNKAAKLHFGEFACLNKI